MFIKIFNIFLKWEKLSVFFIRHLKVSFLNLTLPTLHCMLVLNIIHYGVAEMTGCL